MFARKLAVLAVLLVAAPAFGDFHSTLSFVGTDDGAALASGGSVEEGSLITLLVKDEQIWPFPPPDPATVDFPAGRNHMTIIQLNFEASTPELLTTLVAPTTTWTWDMLVSLTMMVGIDDSLVNPLVGDPPSDPDYLVNRLATTGWPPPGMDGTAEDLGTLALTAPDYDPGGVNTYTVALDGGIYDPVEEIATLTMLIGWGPGDRAGNHWPDTITLPEFTFTVTPEPATVALLALGGAVMFIRRRR